MMNVPGGSNGGSDKKSLGQFAGQLGRSAADLTKQWTTRKYTLPDKNVASQVLMYRQLLHTKCRPGLKLSRDYQGTPAQVAVKHMPWWSEGCETTGKMVISYDNLVQRLWLHGAIFPYQEFQQQQQEQQQNEELSQNAADFLSSAEDDHFQDVNTTSPTTKSSNAQEQDTLLDPETGNPPVPHDFWVERLGFQQPDPVTDFRSGGVLSLAMMVYIAESCPELHQRYCKPAGDASVLPFGLTCINTTDMMAKFLMLAKSTDRMDALLSQKPFWNMFSDPSALLACQELAMSMLADVVVELRRERQEEAKASSGGAGVAAEDTTKDVVTVFDFSWILEKTERRVEYDLLGAGPRTVTELRAIHAKLKVKYQQRLETKLARISSQRQEEEGEKADATGSSTAAAAMTSTTSPVAGPPLGGRRMPSTAGSEIVANASKLADSAIGFGGSVLAKIKNPGFQSIRRDSGVDSIDFAAGSGSQQQQPIPTFAQIPPLSTPTNSSAPTAAALPPHDFLSGSTEEKKDSDVDFIDSNNVIHDHHAAKGGGMDATDKLEATLGHFTLGDEEELL